LTGPGDRVFVMNMTRRFWGGPRQDHCDLLYLTKSFN
jgi:hypothetical protein